MEFNEIILIHIKNTTSLTQCKRYVTRKTPLCTHRISFTHARKRTNEESDREGYKNNMFIHPFCTAHPSNERWDEPSLAQSILSPRAYSCASGRVWRRVRRTKSSGWVVAQYSGQHYKIREKKYIETLLFDRPSLIFLWFFKYIFILYVWYELSASDVSDVLQPVYKYFLHIRVFYTQMKSCVFPVTSSFSFVHINNLFSLYHA